jgi:hypothetical protein
MCLKIRNPFPQDLVIGVTNSKKRGVPMIETPSSKDKMSGYLV